jgi:hypothetical protein
MELPGCDGATRLWWNYQAVVELPGCGGVTRLWWSYLVPLLCWCHCCAGAIAVLVSQGCAGSIAVLVSQGCAGVTAVLMSQGCVDCSTSLDQEFP